MNENTGHQNSVLSGLTSAYGWLPLLPWEGLVAAVSGAVLTVVFDLGPLPFVAIMVSVLGALFIWRRIDHDRRDYVLAWWRGRFSARAYTLLSPDLAYKPVRRLPAGYRLGLPRVAGQTAVTHSTVVERLGVSLGFLPAPLSEQIPLWDILEDHKNGGLLVTPTGGAVIGYDMTGLHTVYADEPLVLDACRGLYFGAAQLPDHWEAQVIMRAEPPDSETFEAFEALRQDASPVAKEQASVRASYLADKRPRRFRIRLYVSRVHNEASPFRARPDPSETLKAAAAAETFFKSAGIQLRRLSAAEIFSDFADALRAGSAAPPPMMTHDESPRAALLTAPVTWTPDAVRIGSRYVKVLTLSKLQGATAFTDIETLFLEALPFDFSLVAYVRMPPRARTRAKIELSSRIAYASATGARVPSGLAQERFEDLREALETDQAGKQRIAHFGLQVAVWGRTLTEVQDRAEAVQNRLMQRNYTLLEETGRHDRQYLSTMVPGGLPQFDRWIQVLTNNVVDLLPLFDSREGDTVPACLFETDRGELWAYDPSAAHRTNWNSFVVGASGSGKSVLVNALIANACLSCAASRGRVLIVDFAGPDKSSYLMLAGIYGGRFMPIVADGTGLNPFPPRSECVDETGALDSHTEGFLTVLVDLMVENQDRGKDTRLYRNLIQEALRALYASAEEPCFYAFLRILELQERRAPDNRRANLIQLLNGTLSGPGGRLLTSTDRLVADEPFIIFDLFGIEGYTPEIREAIVLTVCDAVRRLAFSTLGGEEKKKYIFLDEVAQLVRQDGVVALIQELYATARKHGTAVTTVTQKYADFVASGLAETVRSNSTTGIFLSHAADAASRDLIARDMSLNGRERHLFETLHVKKGDYSEFLLRVDDGVQGITSAKLRLGLPPFEYELYTSDVEDRRRQQRIRNAYPDASQLEVLKRAARRSS